jgi:uncharacterized protein (DUF486 family)
MLLTVSNIFMTFAWYGHLRFKSTPLWEAILVSWLIAFLEYCFQVPANRLGSMELSAAQLKILQEVITLVVFSAFSVFYLRQQFSWNYLAAFGCILGAVYFVFAQEPAAAVSKAKIEEMERSEKIAQISLKQSLNQTTPTTQNPSGRSAKLRRPTLNATLLRSKTMTAAEEA